MTKTVQLSPAELDGVVTTDERWDASRDVMHHLEGETTISEEKTAESESTTRTKYSKIALTTFLYQMGTRFVGLMNVSSLKQEEIPDKIRAGFDRLKDYITLHQAPKRSSASRSGFKDTRFYHDSSEFGATLFLQDTGGAEPMSQCERWCFICDSVL